MITARASGPCYPIISEAFDLVDLKPGESYELDPPLSNLMVVAVAVGEGLAKDRQ